MELGGDQVDYFLDRRTGEVIMLTEDIKAAVEDEESLNDCEEWIRAQAQKFLEIKDTDDCLQLPNRFEMHEHRMMEVFIETIEDNRLRQNLLESIHGRGAF